MAFNRMIMKKIRISAEIFYLVAFNLIGLAVALLDKGHFGMSTIVAPNYAIYLKVSQTIWPGATLGVISYIIQGCLLIALCLVIRRFRFTYLLSFFTAVVTGYSIDGFMALMASWPAEAIWLRILYFVVGMPISSLGIACMLHTYMAPEVFELIIKEVPRKFGFDLGRFKTGYDIACVAAALILSFAFFGFGHFEGVGVGTIVAALVNGALISTFSKVIDRHVEVVDWLPFRKYF